MKKKTLLLVLISISVFLVDLLSKQLAYSFLSNKEVYIIDNIFYLCLAKNTGGAWSIFSNFTFVLAILSVVVLFYIIKSISSKSTRLELFSYSLLIGGIVGNLFDRVFRGYVIDFIGVIIFKYRFPIFNIADIAICIGAVLLIIAIGGGKE